MIICIPSHKRIKLLCEKTLPLLPKGLEIHVYCPTPEEALEYNQHLAGTNASARCVGNAKNLTDELNKIPLCYPEGTEIIIVEDDLNSIERKGGVGMEQKTLPMSPEEIAEMFRLGFIECHKAKATLWGVNPVCNGFYMDHKVSTHLKFIVNCIAGIIVSHDPMLKLRARYKADYERSCLHYLRDGAVVRLNDVGCKTNFYTNPGGLQQDTARGEKEQASVDYLLARFPHFLKLNEKRAETSRYPELSFKRVNEKTDYKKIQKFWDFKINLNQKYPLP